VSSELIAVLMFASMLSLMLTGQRVFAAVGFVAAGAALLLYGTGGVEMPFNATFKLFNWFPMLTLPLFIYMGYVLSESGIAEDLYRMLHVWFGKFAGGLAIGTILLMVIISAMNGLSVAGMAIGSAIALPEMLRRGYDKVLITGVVQGGSSLGILIPPSVVMVLYGVIARQPVSQLWLAGVGPGLLMATLFCAYIYIRVKANPSLAPCAVRGRAVDAAAREARASARGHHPLRHLLRHDRPVRDRLTSLVESSAVGATAATLAAWWKGRLSRAMIHATATRTLAISCMFLWLILAALAFSSVFDGIGAVRAIERSSSPTGS
jgi:tripartite ATP-independent transporter DctM subunit